MDVFDQQLHLLKNLFQNQINVPKEQQLRNIFDTTENFLYNNLKRFSNREIKYLLICEAPPETGNYFYNNYKKTLFTTVWNTFYSNPVCSNHDDAYKCLADVGFLLVDTLPYAMDYSINQKIRKNNSSYDALIKACLLWWINKLNSNFIFAPDLKIAFGFKLNAQSLIKATGGTICLGAKDHPLTPNMIAASGAGQPTIANLERIFKIASKQICHRCP